MVTGQAIRRQGREQMTKSELIAEVADRRGVTIRKAEEVVNTIFESMAEALGSGDRIEVRGATKTVFCFRGTTG